MANVFKDISQFTLKVAATGNEEFQVSATEKITAQQIADLASSGLNVYTISESESQNQKIDASRVEELKKSAIVLFPNEVGYTPYLKVSADDSKAYFITGIIPINSQGQPGINNGEEPPFEQVHTVMIEVDLTTYDITIQPYPVVKKEWLQLSAEGGGIETVEITDFAIPGLNITKDGESFLFYANDASNIPNSNHGATSFVGVAIASPIFITGDQRLLYYMMVDTAKAMFYTGYANLEDDAVTWSDTPVTRLGQAVQVTAFTEGALSSLLHTFKAGDFIPFYTGNVTASTANQFPESGAFNGFISMGSNEGDYFQIFAFKTGSNKAYLGACIGSTTQWTQIGGSSAVEKLSTWLEQGTEVAPHINIGFGEVQVPLNRALKESDILRIDFMRRSEASTFYMQGVAIVHVGAVDNSIQGYAAALDEQYVDYGTGEFAVLAFDANTKLIGHNYFNLHIDTNGSVPQDDYYIMGVYNISGK